MGNTGSSATLISGISSNQDLPIYKLVDQLGGGDLIPWARHGMRTNDWSILDGYIEIKVSKFLINEGNGKPVAIADLVRKRNEERNAMLGALRRKKGRGKAGPNVLDQMGDMAQGADMMKVLKKFDGGKKGGAKYREIVWDTEQRGGMGETLIHVCLLQGTAVHNILAKRILNQYPKLVNDIFLSEDYYGQTALHQAVVNEDAKMVRFLLSHGADVNQRVYGAFFTCDDQRASRTDNMEYEWVDLPVQTNYHGRTYWGETPLAFAACTQQEELYRIIRANKGDPNIRDSNDNTVLHMCVIHDLPYMFDVAYQLGGKLHAINKQNLTPLNLAAKLGKAQIFQHILNVEREVLWEYGGVVCAAYPLNFIDTIDITNGEINDNSALAHIVFGESEEHLDLLPGLMDDLLKEKWESFARSSLIKKFVSFFIYWLMVFTAYVTRYYGAKHEVGHWWDDVVMHVVFNEEHSQPEPAEAGTDMTTANNSTLLNETTTTAASDVTATAATNFYTRHASCVLMRLSRCPNESVTFAGYTIEMQGLDACVARDVMRMSFEVMVVIYAVVQLAQNLLLIRRNSWRKYIRTMRAFPSNLIFTLSLILLVCIVPLRLVCAVWLEHGLVTVIVICTTFRFFFFCRGIKFVGPFVLMIYRIVMGDMLRFFMIYAIIAIGFSQSFYIIFLSCYRGMSDEEFRKQPKIIMHNWAEAILRCFIMSIGEFTEFYGKMNECRLKSVGKVLFIVFELLVSILLINLLIAMMARTYEQIAGTANEWKRQWATVILMLEESLTPKERMRALLRYSRPLTMDKRKRSFVVQYRRTPDELSERMEERKDELHRYREHRRALIKRRLMAQMGGGDEVRAGRGRLQPSTSGG